MLILILKLQDILDKTSFWSGIDIDDCLAMDIAKIQQKSKQMYECIQKISIWRIVILRKIAVIFTENTNKG